MYVVEFSSGRFPWQWQRICQIPFSDEKQAREFADNSIKFSKLMDAYPNTLNDYLVREIELSFEMKSEIARQCFEEQQSLLKQQELELSHNRQLAVEAIQIAQATGEKLKDAETKLADLSVTTELLSDIANGQQSEIEQMYHRETIYDNVVRSEGTYLTNQIAKELGMSAKSLNDRLHKLGVQYKQRKQWLLSAKYQAKGYTKTETHYYDTQFGRKSRTQTVWTEEGRMFIKSVLSK